MALLDGESVVTELEQKRPDPPLSINPTEIYHKHVGMLPNYAGHVPGAMFSFGKTYGNDTRDAKRWLRADFN